MAKAGVENSGLLWKRMGDRKVMIQEITTKWKEQGIDLLLTPTFPFPAVPHGYPGRLQRMIFVAYSLFYLFTKF